LNEQIYPQLDGCIVWNAHNTVLGEEALAYLYVSSNTKSPALRPTSVPSGILIHQPLGHNRHRQKFRGAAVPLMWELGSPLTQRGLGQHVPP